MENLLAAGLERDCPFAAADDSSGTPARVLDSESVEGIDDSEFLAYVGQINTYLQVRACPPYSLPTLSPTKIFFVLQ